MNQVFVRAATVGDAPRLGQIKVGAWRSAYEGLIDAAVLLGMDADEWAERFRTRVLDRFADPGEFLLVGGTGEVVTGYVSGGAYRDKDLTDSGEIFAVYVDPATWRTGVGRRLMVAAIDHLSSANFQRAALWVLADNQVARTFYESLGWHVDSEVQERGHGALEVRYVTELNTG
jgi:ribosomal protein S18 acetylase RimI-like enzyme